MNYMQVMLIIGTWSPENSTPVELISKDADNFLYHIILTSGLTRVIYVVL